MEEYDMENILVVVDMQNDFIDGSLGTEEAKLILPKVVEKLKNFEGKVFFTRDTHGDDYLDTVEGQHLPVNHCIEGTEGWEIHEDLKGLVDGEIIDKVTFGSKELAENLYQIHQDEGINSITLMGLCTDICVISNALLLKAFMPDVRIIADGTCSAGVSPESHKRALDAMKVCHIEVIE